MIRKRALFAAITVLSILWLLFLVSDFSSAGLGEVFSTFAGQQLREDNEERVSRLLLIALDYRKQILIVHT